MHRRQNDSKMWYTTPIFPFVEVDADQAEDQATILRRFKRDVFYSWYVSSPLVSLQL